MSDPNIQTSQNTKSNSKTLESVETPKTQALALAGKKFHFIGVGGIGMSGLAKMLISNNAIVSGSDQTESPVTKALSKAGAGLKIGHNAANLPPDLEAIVISAAIKDDNPELALAKEQGIKVYKYAQMLGQVFNQYDGIAVSGTHGKSTASAWLAFCLKQIGLDPGYIIGADIAQLGGSSAPGTGTNFIAEACEYDRSFLNLKPKVATILNIEADHLDYYSGVDEIVETFLQFAKGIKNGGRLIANGQDKNVIKLICKLPPGFPCQTFGFADSCNYSAQQITLENGLYSFEVVYNGRSLGTCSISLPGKHNILNALAVIAMARTIGIEPKDIMEQLPKFTGIDRRLMLKTKIDGITIIDDYAHHPTEIRASLEAIRQRYEPKRLFCVFQPHQYSRTRFLLDDFAESFKLADITILPEIYFVRDTQESKKQVNSLKLVERIRAKCSKAIFIDGFEEICQYLEENIIAGDAIVTMGAGDIWKVADDFISRLGQNS
jgi:UDP-N-acetylmuramate--alanine ligase